MPTQEIEATKPVEKTKCAGGNRKRGWAAHGGDDQRNGDERSNPEHVAHVERTGLQQTESAGRAVFVRVALEIGG